MSFALPTGSFSVAVADLNGDGKPDAVATNNWGGSVSVLLGNGNGTFQTQAAFGTGSEPGSVTVADFNGDGKPDVAVGNGYIVSNYVSVLLGNGNGTFKAQTTFTTFGRPSVAAADVNG